MTYEQQVFQAYAKTVSRGDHETAAMMAWRKLGYVALKALPILICCAVIGFLGGCNSDRAPSTSSVSAASLVATPPPTPVVIGVPSGTKFVNKDVDADIVYRGMNGSGAVIMDIRIDGSQQFRAIVSDPAQFMESVVRSPHWQQADLLLNQAVKE